MHYLEDDLANQLRAYGLGKYASQGAAMAIVKGVKNKTPRTNTKWSDKDCPHRYDLIKQGREVHPSCEG